MVLSRYFCSTLLLLAPCLVHAYIYRAIPMTERANKMYCDSTNIGEANCVVEHNAIGKICQDMKIGKYIVNPYAQRCAIGLSKCGPEHDTQLGQCATFTGCFTVSNTTRACSCMPGFFGNPYVQCFKHCDTDLDCPSPYAECAQAAGETIKRCKCKAGCPGDGVICKPANICTDTAQNTEGHRKCLQTSLTDKRYVCDDGYYLDTHNVCVKIVPLVGDQRLSIIANNLEDGNRIDIGKCFSMEINKGDGKSFFYQMNSGDAVVVKQKLLTKPQLYVSFEIKKNEIVAFGLLENDTTKLTKLFTMSNGLNGCKVDGVTKYRPSGVRDSTSSGIKVEVTNHKEDLLEMDEL